VRARVPRSLSSKSSPHGEPFLFVVMGATGDLMRRKLLPALFRISAGKSSARRFHVLASALDQLNDESYRIWARAALVQANAGPLHEIDSWLEGRFHYQKISSSGRLDFSPLAERASALEKHHGLPGNRVLYLALPPTVFPSAIEGLGQSGMNNSHGWTRMVVEKPFGTDLPSAQKLNALAHSFFDESQIYRIDHYLGKETVQNLLVFRFANAIFESAWNRDRIEKVEITVAEAEGVGKRGAYYEKAGALRDMVQNHLTQLLTLIAMEAPSAFEADAIRHEKAKLLRSVSPIGSGDVVYGQYAHGQIDGQKVPSYREEPGVSPESITETFVSLRLEVANWRWQGVPFYLRTGKRLPRRQTQIALTFRCPPVSIFQPFDQCTIHSNQLLITLQPDEGFGLSFEVKAPGDGIDMRTQSLNFRYSEAFAPLPDAYQTLLQDVASGDPTLFVHASELEAAWRLYDPILHRASPPQPYRAGTWGPDADAVFRASDLSEGK
jgi:glucose-6-phosphate 1-dehydrogenase